MHVEVTPRTVTPVTSLAATSQRAPRARQPTRRGGRLCVRPTWKDGMRAFKDAEVETMEMRDTRLLKTVGMLPADKTVSRVPLHGDSLLSLHTGICF